MSGAFVNQVTSWESSKKKTKNTTKKKTNNQTWRAKGQSEGAELHLYTTCNKKRSRSLNNRECWWKMGLINPLTLRLLFKAGRHASQARFWLLAYLVAFCRNCTLSRWKCLFCAFRRVFTHLSGYATPDARCLGFTGLMSKSKQNELLNQ